MLPRIVFTKLDLEENIDIVKWAFYEQDDSLDVRSYTMEFFPELKDISLATKREKVNDLINELVSKKYKQNKDVIEKEIKRYEKVWNEYNDNYFRELTKYLDIVCDKVITCKVGLIPVFPRYLDDFSFCMSTELDDEKIISTIAHESLHFLWFIKWKELYPYCRREEYDSPYLPWEYSEMVTDPILNNKPFKDILKVEEKSYDSFYELYDGKELVMDNLRKIYAKDISSEDKIREGYDYIKKVMGGE